MKKLLRLTYQFILVFCLTTYPTHAMDPDDPWFSLEWQEFVPHASLSPDLTEKPSASSTPSLSYDQRFLQLSDDEMASFRLAIGEESQSCENILGVLIGGLLGPERPGEG